MADKKYKLNFTMTDGSERSVEFDAPQGPQGEKGEQGEGVFAFTFRGNETCPVTAEEIYAAVEAGNICVAIDNIIGRTYVYHGKAAYNEDASYSVPTFVQPTIIGTDSVDFRYMQIDPNGVARNFHHSDVRIASPRKLYFVGAVNKTYDGSQEVTIRIPSESGGSGTVSSDDIFVVRFSHADGTADKTQAEINEAVSGGKVCIALDASGHVYVYAGVQHGNSDATLRVPTFVDNANYNEDGTLIIEYVQFYSDGTVETFYREANLSGTGGGSSLPEPAGPHQMLVTDSDGNWTQEERLAYKTEGIVEIVPQTTIAKSTEHVGGYFYTGPLGGDVEIGKTCTVTYNGVDYVCEAWQFNLSGDEDNPIYVVALGNKSSAGEDDTGEPFSIIAGPSSVISHFFGATVAISLLKTPLPDEITVKIVGEATTYKKVSFDYLPEGVGGIEIGVVLPEKTYESDGEQFAITTPFTLTVGNNYTVSWNGAEYKCVAQSMDTGEGYSMTTLGNIGLMTGGADTGEPFIIAPTPEGAGDVEVMGAVYILDGSTSVTLSIFVETIRKIPAKYLDTAEIEQELVTLSDKIAPLTGEYELVYSTTIGAGGANQIFFQNIERLSAVMACVTMPAYNSIGIFLRVKNQEDTSYVIGTTFGSTTDEYSIRLEFCIDRGILSGSSQGYVRGWGGGTVRGLNNASQVVFANSIIPSDIYCTSAGLVIPEGTKIELYGVKI